MKENIFKKPQVYIMLFSALNLFRIIFSTNIANLTLIGGLSKLLNLAAPLSVILYFVSEKKGLDFKKYILPVGFGLSTVTVFIAGWQVAALSVYDGVYGTFNTLMIAVQALAMVLMFVGTLFDFENIKYLKTGSLVFIGAATVSIVAGLVLEIIGGAYGFNPLALIEFLILIFFYFGIYLLAKEKSK